MNKIRKKKKGSCAVVAAKIFCDKRISSKQDNRGDDSSERWSNIQTVSERKERAQCWFLKCTQNASCQSEEKDENGTSSYLSLNIHQGSKVLQQPDLVQWCSVRRVGVISNGISTMSSWLFNHVLYIVFINFNFILTNVAQD